MADGNGKQKKKVREKKEKFPNIGKGGEKEG